MEEESDDYHIYKENRARSLNDMIHLFQQKIRRKQTNMKCDSGEF